MNILKIIIKKNGEILELEPAEFLHMIMIDINHNYTDYDNEKLYKMRNDLLEKNYEWVLNNYDEYIEKYGIDELIKLIDADLIKCEMEEK